MADITETIPALDDNIDPSKVAIRFYVKPKEPTPEPFPDPDAPMVPDPAAPFVSNPDDPEGDFILDPDAPLIPDPDAPMIQPPAPDNSLKARLFSEITLSFDRSDGKLSGRPAAVHTFAMRPDGSHPNNLPGMTAAKSNSLRSVLKLMYDEAKRLEGE